MTTRLARRLLTLVAAAVFGTLLAPAHVVAACDQNWCLPMLTGVTPVQITLDGRPQHLTLVGHNLSGVNAVIVSPMAATQGWKAVDDQAVQVTLPADMPPGVYSVRVVSAEGSSDPSLAPQFQVFAAPPPPPPPTPAAKAVATARPTPQATDPVPESGALAVAATPAAQPSSAPPAASTAGPSRVSPTSTPIVIMAGLAIGAMFFILWGNPRRLAGTWKSEPLRHLIGRPAQALHAGSICLYCGRLHFVLFTRRDLWRAGKYCRPRCFISAEATATPLVEEELLGVASRPRRAAHTADS